MINTLIVLPPLGPTVHLLVVDHVIVLDRQDYVTLIVVT
ncbi:hypothetical protein T06_11723 [Trichinella sp. T6]|nr:hypothetical protein T06_11723 [Trichinella sp. T6]